MGHLLRLENTSIETSEWILQDENDGKAEFTSFLCGIVPHDLIA
jgi:hypothetical protein